MATEPTEGGHHFTTELSRDLTLFHVTMMGVGMMIGAGVFIGIGKSVGIVGPGGAIMTFALNGIIAMCSAMSYAELCSAVPRAGGAYNFARIGFGRGTSFFAGWMEWFASTVAGSMYALVFSTYLLEAMSDSGMLASAPSPLLKKAVAVAAIAVFVYINYRGASETGKTGAFFSLGQTVTMGLIAVVGIVAVLKHPARIHNFQPFLTNGWMPLLATMGFTYVAFEGFEVIAQAGDETIEPRRNLPKAMLLSVLIVVVTYVLVAFAAIVAVGRHDLAAVQGVSSLPEWFVRWGDVAFKQSVKLLLSSRAGSILVLLAVVFSSTSALNATIYSATRAVYALGRDQFLPPQLAQISATRKTPVTSLAATAILAIGIAALTPLEHVMSFASMMFLFLFLLVNLCAIRIRRHMGDEMQYGYLMPLFPLPPIIGILAQFFLAAELRHISVVAWIVSPSWIVVGLLLYRFYGRSHVKQTRDEIVTFKEAAPPTDQHYRIMLPVANPDSALQLVTQTLRLAEMQDAQVNLIHMVPIPDQIPLSDAAQYSYTGEEAIAEAMLYMSSRFPLSHTVRYCRNPARGILSAAREHQSDMLIMGWRGRSQRRDFLFGSTLDPILERNPCDVVVLKNCTSQTYKSILVPFAGGPHSLLALKTASILVEPDGGEIVPFNVTMPGKPTADMEAFLEKNAASMKCPLSTFKPKHAVSKHIREAIVEEAKERDLVILGATGERRLHQFAVGSLPEEVAEETDCALIMVKAKTPVKSLLNRWV